MLRIEDLKSEAECPCGSCARNSGKDDILVRMVLPQRLRRIAQAVRTTMGENVRVYREAAGLSQAELSVMADVTRSGQDAREFERHRGDRTSVRSAFRLNRYRHLPTVVRQGRIREFCGAFGGRIRTIREKAQLTQRDVAEFMGITEKRVQEIEAGDESVTIDTITLLADALGVALGSLFDVEPSWPT